LSPTNLLTELAHVKVRVRLPTTRNGNFLMPTHTRSGQAKLFDERLTQFRVLVDLMRRPRVQAGRFSLNTDCVGVSVTVRGHTPSMVGNTSCDEVHGAVTRQEQLR